MFYAILVALHLVVSVILILVVLLQTGKGADLAGAFGGGGSQTAFGSRGAATFLSKLTTGAAIVFMVTSFSLAILSARTTSSVLDEADLPPAPQPAPIQAPATTPADDSGTAAPDSAAPAEEPAPAAGGDAAGQAEPEAPPQNDPPAE